MVHFPKRGSSAAKIKALPSITKALLRSWFDHQSHVIVSHPFSSVTSAFLRTARLASFYDDGTAYYADPPLPTGRRENRDRRLSRKFVDWAAVARSPQHTYPTMLRHSTLQQFFAVFPDLALPLPYPVVAIDMRRAFPPAERTGNKTLFLDTRDDATGQIDTAAVLATLEEIAMQGDGILHFKPHPSQTSRISVALRSMAWAREVDGNLETGPLLPATSRLISFYSSGAISAKAVNHDCQLICLEPDGLTLDPRLRSLFDRLGTEVLRLESIGQDEKGPSL